MPLGARSLERLDTCHPDLRKLVLAVAAGIDAGDLVTAGIGDLTVLCGYRGEAEQNLAFSRKTSKLRYPDSKHNISPHARAVDIAAYPYEAADMQSALVLRGYVLAVASALRVRLRVISWDGPHFELA